MAIPDSYREIIETLATATQKRQLRWKSNVLGVELMVAESRLTLWKGHLRGRPYITFSLSAHDGTALDAWCVEEGEAEYADMQAFFSAAGRQALNIPQRLATICEEIKRIAEAADEYSAASVPPRHTGASDCDASLPSTVTMR